MATLRVKWEDIKTTPKAPSTAFNVGYFISYDGLGGVIPAQSASLYEDETPILGVILEDVQASDVDFASARQVHYQKAENNEFLVEVSAGTAVASMIGSTFDVDGVDPSKIDVSGAGTQLKITQVLADNLVLCEVALSEPQA
jgi:hypothetical protein